MSAQHTILSALALLHYCYNPKSSSQSFLFKPKCKSIVCPTNFNDIVAMYVTLVALMAYGLAYSLNNTIVKYYYALCIPRNSSFYPLCGLAERDREGARLD